MYDMLVRLYDLPDLTPHLARQAEAGIDVRRPLAVEKSLVVEWVLQNFGQGWANECEVSFGQAPPLCYVAVDVEKSEIVGFACHDVVYKNMFGPTGVHPDYRGRGIGAALLLACLHAMHAQGYAYAIIAGVGPAAFYAKVAGAVDIEGSTPGIYRGWLGARLGMADSAMHEGGSPE